jgi:hypothetical protein
MAGLFVFKDLLGLCHFSRRKIFRYEHHPALGACRKIMGEDYPGILEPDFFDLQMRLAPIAYPSAETAGFSPFGHNPLPRFISILWE